MKLLISFFFVFISVKAMAQSPIRLEGTFGYKGVSVFLARDEEIVASNNQARIKELIQNAFQCMPKGPVFKCSKFIHDAPLPANVEKEIDQKFKNTVITFKKGPLDPVIFNDAESITEWDIFDSFSMNAMAVERYQYRLIGGSVHKIHVATDDQDLWFTPVDAKNLFTLEEVELRSNKAMGRHLTLAVAFGQTE